MLTLSSAFLPSLTGPGLNINVNAGVVINNGSSTYIPASTISLSPSTTTYVFLNVSAIAIQSNTTGFPTTNSYPIAIVISNATGVQIITDMRPDVTAGSADTVLFSNVLSGTNTGQTLTVGNGSTLQASGTGIINATEINGIPITGALTHAGQIPISQPGNASAIWADPLVQGLFAPGTNVSTGGTGGAPINPVLIGGQTSSGTLANFSVDASGNLSVTEPQGSPLLELLTRILLELRGLRLASVALVTEGGSYVENDFDPNYLSAEIIN